jgi:hypothetical protein
MEFAISLCRSQSKDFSKSSRRLISPDFLDSRCLGEDINLKRDRCRDKLTMVMWSE